MSSRECAPGDFERQSALILGCNELLPYHPQALVQIVSALIERIPLLGVVDSEEQRRHLLALLCDWGVPAHLLHVVSLPVKGMWVRDYGPFFTRNQDGSVMILDAAYLEADRPEDDEVPSELAALLRLPVERVPLLIEGGNLLSNGRGLCITTSTLFKRNEARGARAADVQAGLRRHYGFTQIVSLRPLVTEPTGHVDMFAAFVSADTIVVGEYDARIDPVNADVLNANAQTLANVEVEPGKRLNVVRIPMPSNRGGVWRTHTNAIFANGTLLMPIYPGADGGSRQQAMDTFRSLLPGWDIEGIDANSIIQNRGALRCVCIQVPWMEHVFEVGAPQGAPDGRRPPRAA